MPATDYVRTFLGLRLRGRRARPFALVRRESMFDFVQQCTSVKVRDLMGPAVQVDNRTSLRQVAHDMLECQVAAVVVIDAAGALCGLITEEAVLLTEHSPYRKALPRGLRRCVSLAEGAEALYSKLGDRPVAETPSETIVTATEDEALTDVLERMLFKRVECVVVLRDELPVGLVGRRDLLRLVAGTGTPRGW